jgi:hypothetical protein
MPDVTENTSLKKAISASLATMTITAGIVSFFFDKYVVPLAILQTKNEFSELSQKSKENESENLELKSQIAKLKTDLQAEGEVVSAAKIKIALLESGNLFMPSSPYPAGLGKIRIGDPVDALKNIYAASAITWPNEDEGEHKAEVETGNSFFTRADYNYEPKSRKIVGISFTANYLTAQGILLSKLSDSFGLPTTSKPKGMYKWRLSQTINAYLMTPTLYLIVSSDRAPLLWPQDQ